MAFTFPGTSVKVRVFDRVETKDEQYDVFDIGLEYEDGTIDSIAAGISAGTIKNFMKKDEAKRAKKAKKKADKAAKKASSTEETPKEETSTEEEAQASE